MDYVTDHRATNPKLLSEFLLLGAQLMAFSNLTSIELPTVSSQSLC